MYRMLGFDTEFDQTAIDTRAQARTRAVVSVVVLLSGLSAIDWPLMAAWFTTFIIGDGLLWVATDPKNQARHPVTFRILRLAATGVSTCAWVGIGILWWLADGDYTKAAGACLIGGVLVYMVRGCHKSLAQMLVTGIPPTVALLALPMFEQTWRERLGLLSCTMMLVAYALSSAVSAVRAYAQLRTTTAALVVKQEEAEAASVSKSEFLANMSHEIRTPLNGVLAMAHVLFDADLPPREKEAAELICTSGETLERLLSDILDLAKVESGQLDMETTDFHAGALVRSCAEMSRATAEAKSVSLSVTVEPAVDSYYQGDPVRVRQVVMNLLSNAVKFTSHGAISLSLSGDAKGSLRFAVRDSGVGFPAEQKDRLFDRFQQADGTITRRFGGTGLGLAISRQLVEKMGGVLDCESRVGEGSLFYFDLPLAEGAEVERPDTVRPDQTQAGLRLLVVDDHAMNLKVVQIILADADFEVTTAGNGREGVNAWTNSHFDLVLMDMQMPVMDGLAAVTEIRAVEQRTGRSRTPIVMLTANASPEHVLAGKAAGADGHLTKPITPIALFAAIEASLRGIEHAESDARSAAHSSLCA